MVTLVMTLSCRKIFRLHRTSPALFALAALLVVLLIGRAGFDTIDARFGQTIDEQGLSENGKTLSGRASAWQDCLQLIADFTLTGSGAGTFYAIFPSYQTNVGATRMRQAHNEYLELATDQGLIASLAVGLFFLVFFRKNYRMFRVRKDGYAKHVYIGSLAGLVALLLHSITDYQFRQTMAIPLYFFVLMGINTAAIHGRRDTAASGPSLLKTYRPQSWLIFAGSSCLVVLTIGAAIYSLGVMQALSTVRMGDG